jgi:hypothetical protein
MVEKMRVECDVFALVFPRIQLQHSTLYSSPVRTNYISKYIKFIFRLTILHDYNTSSKYLPCIFGLSWEIISLSLGWVHKLSRRRAQREINFHLSNRIKYNQCSWKMVDLQLFQDTTYAHVTPTTKIFYVHFFLQCPSKTQTIVMMLINRVIFIERNATKKFNEFYKSIYIRVLDIIQHR